MKIKNQYVLKEIAGENIVIPTGQEAVSFNGIITLNNSATMLFKRLQEETKQEDLIRLFLETYNVDEATAVNDVNDFIAIMKKHHLLET
jgi:hypothetical protein